MKSRIEALERLINEVRTVWHSALWSLIYQSWSISLFELSRLRCFRKQEIHLSFLKADYTLHCTYEHRSHNISKIAVRRQKDEIVIPSTRLALHGDMTATSTNSLGQQKSKETTFTFVLYFFLPIWTWIQWTWIF